jgi:hypothetical protein
MINLSIDLLNRIIESKIEIYDEITYNNKSSELVYDFLERYKYDADSKLVSLIIENREIVYKYIYNKLKIQYKLIFLNKSTFSISNEKINNNLDFEYYLLDDKEEKILHIIKNEVDRIISGNTNLSYNIFYLLRFKYGIHYKLGISNQLDFSRLKILSDLYDIDFNKSIIYYGLKRDIQLIENYLKKLIPEIYDNPYKGKDGFSEIRDIKSFEKVFEKCENQFSKDFSLIKYELKNLEPDWKQKIKKTKNSSKSTDIDLPEIGNIFY